MYGTPIKQIRRLERLQAKLERLGDKYGTEAQLDATAELLFGAIARMTPAQFNALMREAKVPVK